MVVLRTILLTMAIVLGPLAGAGHAAVGGVSAIVFSGVGQQPAPPVIVESGPVETPDAVGWIDRVCLSAALYHEARGEDVDGQRAVAQVILNRVRSRAYPPSICGVVYDGAHRRTGCQFSFACDRLSDYPAESAVFDELDDLSAAILRKARYGLPIRDWSIAMATHYHATYVSPGWARRIDRLERIGRHIFYRSERVTRQM